MTQFDLPLDQLQTYRSAQTAPDDFDAFWQRTVEESRALGAPPRLIAVDSPIRIADVYDVSFSGFGGQPIRAWLKVPRGLDRPAPVIVQYIGYGGGRGRPIESLHWLAGGAAVLVMDTRGQGGAGSVGETPDLDGASAQAPGYMTRGILSPETYYYRRVITDAVRAIDAVADIDLLDADRIVAAGTSQGGGLALAASALSPQIRGTVALVPFLCDFPRAIRITDNAPYSEIVRYLSVHRESVEAVLSTLRYFDGVNFAARGRVPLLASAALMDATCPPSTVFGAVNAWQGPSSVNVWPFNTHEGGGPDDHERALAFIHQLLD